MLEGITGVQEEVTVSADREAMAVPVPRAIEE